MHESWAAKMTDVKSVSVEVPEGKLTKKVSGCTCQNVLVLHVTVPLPVSTWFIRVGPLKLNWQGYLYI